MNASEIARWLILGALAIVTYLLVLAWQRDHQVAADAGALVAPSATARQNSDIPVPASADVPAVATGVATPSHAHAPSSAPIVVETDVLRTWIEPLGGDIVRVEFLAYPQSLDRLSVPVVLLNQGSDGHVYVAQSGLVGRNGPDSSPAGRPRYVASQQKFTLSPGASTLDVALTFTDAAGVRYEKHYTFKRDDYEIGLKQIVRNTSPREWRGNAYAQLKRDDSVPESSASGLGPKPFVGAAITRASEKYSKLPFSDIEDEPVSAVEKGGWIAMMQHYFLSAWIGDANQTNSYFARKARDGTYLVGFTGPEMIVRPGTNGVLAAKLYVGPKVQSRLERAAPNLNLTVDYGFLWFLASLLFQLMHWLHGHVQNWGVSIILMTGIVKLVLYPLSAASYRSMAKMREVAPEMRRLQERYADDRQRLGQEMMELYKKEKVNPLGGCLPMLLQMPVFLSLYWVLYESVELRLSPFFGWIHDLASMDPYFVLPLLMGVTMYGQQMLNPPMPDPMQARMMKMMPAIFTVMFAFFPAGLVLYWLVNNLLSIAQQWWVTRQIEALSKARAKA